MAAREEALSAGNVLITGHGGDEINAYQALTGEPGHDRVSWSSTTCPGGTHPPRRSRGGSPPTATTPSVPTSTPAKGSTSIPTTLPRRPAAKGGVPDEQFLGDASGAIDALRALPNSNGKVGVIGYCSGGRQSFLTAVSLPVDAAVDCYGAFVTGTIPDGFPLKVVALVDQDALAPLPAARAVRRR